MTNWFCPDCFTLKSKEEHMLEPCLIGATSFRARAAGPLSASFVLVVMFLLPGESRAQEHQIFNDGASAPEVSSSIIQGGIPAGASGGGGILEVDPLFADPAGPDGVEGTLDDDVRLQQDSPAIDAGDGMVLPQDLSDLDGDGDASEPMPIDLAGLRRVVDGGSGRLAVDLGAYEFGASATRAADPVLPADVVLFQSYPNPFHARTTLQFSLARREPVEIKLYDALGREIKTIYRGTPTPGTVHAVELDQRDLPSGRYFVRLLAEDRQLTRMLTRIR